MHSRTTRELAIEERRDILDLLATLTEEQWRQPSLCAGWSVRDLVAHMISYDGLGLPRFLRHFARSGFDPVRANDRRLALFADLGPEQLTARFREHLVPTGFPTSFGCMIALLDGMIHHQDIRRAIGLPRQIPVPRLERALNRIMYAVPVGARPRVKGLRLVATDVGWSYGTGPELTGPGEALLMAAAGRRVAAAELSGPGVAILSRRLAN